MAYLHAESHYVRRPASTEPTMPPGLHLKFQMGFTFPCSRQSGPAAAAEPPHPRLSYGQPQLYTNYAIYPEQQPGARRSKNRLTSQRRGTSEPRNGAGSRQRRRLPQQAHTIATFPKPLPPLPSRFRLGEDDLPWSSPEWPAEAELYETPTVLPITSENPRLQYEDPVRLQNLENFHQAMMTVGDGDITDEPRQETPPPRVVYDPDIYDYQGHDRWERGSAIISPLSSTASPGRGWNISPQSPDLPPSSPWDNPSYIPFSTLERRA